MNRESIRAIIRDVFHQHDLKNTGDWVSFRCPLAPYTHEKGIDRSPSAGIAVNDSGTSIFNCYVCGNPAPLHVLLERFAEYTGEDLDGLIREVENEEYLGPLVMPSWDDSKLSEESIAMPIDEAVYMSLYDPAAGHPYLRSRGISDATAKRLELMFDDQGTVSDREPRILFPVRGMDGLLYGFSGRAINKRAAVKVRDYCGLKKAHSILGAHLASQGGAVIVVEGLVDYARTHECGYAGCGLLHSGLTEFQAEILRDINKPVYAFMDNDDAGHKGLREIGEQLVQHVPVMRVRYPKRWIEIDFQGTPVPGHWLKDPGEMEPEEFDEMIAGARLY